MPLFTKIEDQNAIMGIWKSTEPLAELEAQYVIKPSEQETYAAFRNDRRRKEWLTVRLLLKELLGRDTEICYRDSGKPYLKDQSYCISITHTIGYVGIRLASHPVALDMEYHSERVLRLIDRFVSKQEMKYIDPDNPIDSALVIWSAKESLFKLFDFHDVLFDKHLFISNLKPGRGGRFRGTIVKDGFKAEVRLTYKIFDELILVYC